MSGPMPRVALSSLVAILSSTLVSSGLAGAGPALPAVSATEHRRRLVAVVRAPDADSASQEIATRIIAELMAARIPVIALTCGVADRTCVPVSGPALAAVVLVEVRNNLRAVEVRSGDSRAAGRASSWVVAGGPDRGHASREDETTAPAALAVRTVELLRAMSFQVGELAPRAPATEASLEKKLPAELAESMVDRDDQPAATATVELPPPRPLPPMGAHNVTVGIGAAIVGAASSLGAAYGPTVRVGRHAFDHLLFSLLLAGPAFGQTLQNDFGTVSIRQELAAFETDVVGLFRDRYVLRLGIAGGVYHMRAQGQAVGQAFPLQVVAGGLASRHVSGYSGLLSWSASAVVNLRDDLGLFVDGRVSVLAPAQVVQLNTAEVGRAGNPHLTISAGVELRL